MKVFDTTVKVGDMDCICMLSVKAPYGIRQGNKDMRVKWQWCMKQGWVHDVDFKPTRPVSSADVADWSDYHWWFADINKAYYFLFRWS